MFIVRRKQMISKNQETAWEDRMYRRTVKLEVQEKAIKFIRLYRDTHSITPTQEVLSQELHLQQSTISTLLKNLEERGEIVRGGGNYAIK